MSDSTWTVTWDQDTNLVIARRHRRPDPMCWTAAGNDFGVTSWTCAVTANSEDDAKRKAEGIVRAHVVLGETF